MMKAEPTVYIVDDESAVRDAASCLLQAYEMKTETFASAAEFLDQFDPSKPGCLLLDLRMPGMDGLELQHELQKREASIPILFLSGNADVPTAVTGVTRGAVGFLEKPIQPTTLLSAIRKAIQQDLQTRQHEKQYAETHARLETLTVREREILDLVVAGKPTKIIALELGTADNTVNNQRASILAKMKAESAADLVRMVVMATSVSDSLTNRTAFTATANSPDKSERDSKTIESQP